MTSLATEAWPGADGAAWPSQWTKYASGAYAGTSDTKGGKGRLVPAAMNYQPAPFMVLAGAPASLPLSASFDYSFSANAEAFGVISLRAPNAIGDPANFGSSTGGYQLTLCATYSGEIDLTVGASTAIVASFVPSGYLATTPWSCRYQALNGRVQARIWQAGTTEPTTWQIDYADATQTAAGYLAASCTSGYSTAPDFYLDNLALTDGVAAVAPKPQFMAFF